MRASRVSLIIILSPIFTNTIKYVDRDDVNTNCSTDDWTRIGSKCTIRIDQFRTNHSMAPIICKSMNNSKPLDELNWLAIKRISEELSLDGLYWTQWTSRGRTLVGVSSNASIFNPMATDIRADSCVALRVGPGLTPKWVSTPCQEPLETICEHRACPPRYFRCLDDSACIPDSLVHDTIADCPDSSDEWSGGDGMNLRQANGVIDANWVSIVSPNNKHFIASVVQTGPVSIIVDGRVLQIDHHSPFRISASSFAVLRSQSASLHFMEIEPVVCRLPARVENGWIRRVLPAKDQLDYTPGTRVFIQCNDGTNTQSKCGMDGKWSEYHCGGFPEKKPHDMIQFDPAQNRTNCPRLCFPCNCCICCCFDNSAQPPSPSTSDAFEPTHPFDDNHQSDSFEPTNQFDDNQQSDSVDICSHSPCLNGAQCLSANSSYSCSCPPQFHGAICEIPCHLSCSSPGVCEFDDHGVARCSNDNERIIANDDDFLLEFSEQSNADIVSNRFSKYSAREFTICTMAWLSRGIADDAPILALRSIEGGQQIVLSKESFRVCDDQCDKVEVFKNIRMEDEQWNKICVKSPAHDEKTPTYTIYLNGKIVLEVLANRFLPAFGYIAIVPRNLGKFVGKIGITRMYVIRLDDAFIHDYPCVSVEDDEIVLDWSKNFTRITHQSGIQKVRASFCPTRRKRSVLTVDRSPPTLLKCPQNIQQIVHGQTKMRIEWDESSIEFRDDVGISNIYRSFSSGNYYGIGITKVKYIAQDEAGNLAECSWNIIISQHECPKDVQINYGGSEIIRNSDYSPISVYVNCEAFVTPKLYICDLMGNWNPDDLDWINNTYQCPLISEPIQTIQIRESCDKVLHKMQSYPISCTASTITSTSRQNLTRLVERLATVTNFDWKCSNPLSVLRQIDSDEFICAECGRGHQVIDNECVLCEIGWFLDGTSCKKCDPGLTSNRLYCHDACNPGEYYDYSNTECKQCEKGTFSVDGKYCEPCGVDSTTTNEGSTKPSDCSLKCPPGFQLGYSICEPCSLGTYKGEFNDMCNRCPAGLTTTTNGAKFVEDCDKIECLFPNTKRNSQIRPSVDTPYHVLCRECEPGTFQFEINQDECIDCSHFNNSAIPIPDTCTVTKKRLRSEHNALLAARIVLPIVSAILLVVLIAILLNQRKRLLRRFSELDWKKTKRMNNLI